MYKLYWGVQTKKFLVILYRDQQKILPIHRYLYVFVPVVKILKSYITLDPIIQKSELFQRLCQAN